MSRVPRVHAAGHSDRVPHDTKHLKDESHAAEALRLVVQARDAEIRMLKLMVQKLKLQLARRNRMVFGSLSERFVDPAQERSTARATKASSARLRTAASLAD